MASDRGQANEVQVVEATYKAVILVNTTKVTRTADAGGYFNAAPVEHKTDLAKIEVKASTIEGIALKIKQHVDLLGDE